MIGGTGPSGYHIVEKLLKRGYEVSIYHTGAHELEYSRPVQHVHGNPRDKKVLEMDLAGRHFDVTISTYGSLRQIQEVMRGKTPRFLVVTGLPAVHRWSVPPGEVGIPVPIPEDAPLATPEDPGYGDRVARGEKIVLEAHAQGIWNASIFRYTMVYGPYTYIPFEWYIVRRVLDGRKHMILEGDGCAVPQRGYSETLAEGIISSIDNPRAAGQVYNIGDTRGLSVRGLVHVICEALGARMELIEVPLAIVSCKNPFSKRGNTLMDMSKIKCDLGFRDVMPIEDATALTARWMRDHPFKSGSSEELAVGQGAFDYEAEDDIVRRWRKSMEVFAAR